MSRIVLGAIVVIALVIGGVAFFRSRSNNDAAVIVKVEQGASESAMLSAINESNRGALSADDVIKLKHDGVPNNVIIEMFHKFGTQ